MSRNASAPLVDVEITVPYTFTLKRQQWNKATSRTDVVETVTKKCTINISAQLDIGAIRSVTKGPNGEAILYVEPHLWGSRAADTVVTLRQKILDEICSDKDFTGPWETMANKVKGLIGDKSSVADFPPSFVTELSLNGPLHTFSSPQSAFFANKQPFTKFTLPVNKGFCRTGKYDETTVILREGYDAFCNRTGFVATTGKKSTVSAGVSSLSGQLNLG